jgi:monoamine oxidase
MEPPGVQSALACLDLLAAEVQVEAPWLAPRAQEWDGQTFMTWLAGEVPDDDARWFVQTLVEGTFAAEVRQLSLLHVLFGIASAGGTHAMLEGGAEEGCLVGGAQGLAEQVGRHLGDRVLLRAQVDHVSWTPSAVVIEGPHLSVAADRAIIALPPHLAGRLRYEPMLPGLRDQLTQSLPMGAVVKVQYLYDQPFWRKTGLSGHSMSDSSGLALSTFDSSPGADGPGVLTGLIVAGSARRCLRLAPEERRDLIITRLVELFGPQAGQPIELFEKCWPDDPWSGGGYDAHFPPGVWTVLGDALRQSVGPLHWAGSETATIWCGYLDGAISSGERAADEVLSALGGNPPPLEPPR